MEFPPEDQERLKIMVDFGTPELILGEPLPKSAVLWAKDIRLLYRGDKRKKQA